MPETAKVLISNLTKTSFFFETGNIPLQIKLLANSLPAHLLAA